MLPYEKVQPIHEYKMALFAEQAENARAGKEARAGDPGRLALLAGAVSRSLGWVKLGSPRKARPAT